MIIKLAQVDHKDTMLIEMIDQVTIYDVENNLSNQTKTNMKRLLVFLDVQNRVLFYALEISKQLPYSNKHTKSQKQTHVIVLVSKWEY